MSAEELESCIASGMVKWELYFQTCVMLNLKIPYELIFVGEGKGDPQFSKTPSCSSCSLKYRSKWKLSQNCYKGIMSVVGMLC